MSTQHGYLTLSSKFLFSQSCIWLIYLLHVFVSSGNLQQLKKMGGSVRETLWSKIFEERILTGKAWSLLFLSKCLFSIKCPVPLHHSFPSARTSCSSLLYETGTVFGSFPSLTTLSSSSVFLCRLSITLKIKSKRLPKPQGFSWSSLFELLALCLYPLLSLLLAALVFHILKEVSLFLVPLCVL